MGVICGAEIRFDIISITKILPPIPPKPTIEASICDPPKLLLTYAWVCIPINKIVVTTKSAADCCARTTAIIYQTLYFVSKKNMINDERLIDLVRGHEILYNKSCAGYKLHDQKLAAWASIAQEFGVTGEECNKRWTSLRERFSREQRALDNPSGSGATSNRPWYLMQSMEFIKPYVTPRPTRCSSNILKGYSASSTSENPSQLWSPPPSSPLLFSSADTNEMQQQQLLDDPVPFTPPTSKRKRQLEKTDDDFREVCQIFKEVQKERLGENRRLRSFGDMIVASLAEMSDRKQAKAIKVITTEVMNIQLESEE